MWYRHDAEAVILNLHVQPGAKHNEIAGLHGDALKIKLASPPIDGKRLINPIFLGHDQLRYASHIA